MNGLTATVRMQTDDNHSETNLVLTNPSSPLKLIIRTCPKERERERAVWNKTLRSSSKAPLPPLLCQTQKKAQHMGPRPVSPCHHQGHRGVCGSANQTRARACLYTHKVAPNQSNRIASHLCLFWLDSPPLLRSVLCESMAASPPVVVPSL